MHEKNYKLLADAIIMQAVKDYRNAKSPAVRNDITRFFLSEQFCILSPVDGKKLLRKLDQEQHKKIQRKEIQNVGIQN